MLCTGIQKQKPQIIEIGERKKRWNKSKESGILITKTCLYNFDPLKPHLYIVKLGFTGVYIIFLLSAQKHRLWVLVRTASPRQFYWVPTIYVLSRNMKNTRIFYLFFFFPFLLVKFSIYLNGHVFVMAKHLSAGTCMYIFHSINQVMKSLYNVHLHLVYEKQ